MVVANADRSAEVVDAVSKVPGLAAPTKPVAKNGVAFFEAAIDADVSSQAAFDIVQRHPRRRPPVDGADALVGGTTATDLDTKNAANRDPLIIPVVFLVVLAILCLLLRSLLAPLLLMGTVVLSFAATLGISSLVFEHIFGFPGADPVVPLFAFVFLVALGIDYNIFLMTRVREEARRIGTRRERSAA